MYGRHIHERFKSKTRLLALEPIARNVAVRRSSAANRWILSTNTDMIFVPLRSRSLSEIVRGLPRGFYHAPRIEIPEVLWEGLDRNNPIDVINTVREWGTTLHLNEIVLGSKFIRYDGPGDFQLLLRSDFFANHGFDEEMLLGWHVDSNIAARMLLKYAEVGDLGAQVYGYHCDHTRQVTPAHSHNRVQNDWRRFVTEIAHPDVPEQASSWGCVGDAIEEVRLSSEPFSVYVQALRGVIGEPLGAPKVVEYTGVVYNKVDYDPLHLLPFLADMFVPMPRTSNLAWYGARAKTLGLFASVWEKLNFTGKILLDRPALQPHAAAAISHVVSSRALADADAFVFDFGGLPTSGDQSIGVDDLSSDLRRSFLRVVREERRRLSQGAAPRRIIALNAINNEYEGFVCGSVAAAATPFATHMRHGFVLPASTAKEAWLSLLSIGEAGVRLGDQIRSDPTKVGWIAYGPYRYLDEGVYLVSVSIELVADEPNRLKNEPCVFFEVRAGSELLAIHLLRYGELKNADCRFTFVVSGNVAEGVHRLETRIAALSPVAIAVRALTIEPSSAPISDEARSDAALRIRDWLPYLRRGPLGRIDEWGVFAETGPPAYVAYGPYWSLPSGKYEMIVLIERGDEAPIPKHLVRVEVVVGNRQLIAGNFHLSALLFDGERAVSVLRLPFELNDPALERRQVETRIFSSGEEPFRIRSLSIKPVARRQRNDLLPYLLIGEVGLRAGCTIRNVDKQIGFVAYSPTIALDPEAYKLTLQATVQTDAGTAVRKKRTYAIVLVKYGAEILAIEAITFEGGQKGNYALTFEAPAVAAPTDGFEFLFQVVAAANVTLHTLVLEHVAGVVPATGPAVCALENWLPFLRTNPSAHADREEGIVVVEGRAGYAHWGPYWTLPSGHYEVVASIVPQAANPDGKPLITIDVSTEDGKRQFAEHQWRLGQFQSADGHTVAELRLPFTLAADLPAALRTVETRVYTSGDAGFRTRSLAVRARSDEAERNWFPYLAVGECGVHTGGEIKSIAERFGHIASTPAMQIAPGHYKVIVDVVAVGAEGADSGSSDSIGLEIWSGSELIANAISANDQPLEFDVTKALTERGVELRIRAIMPTVVSIHGVLVEKTSDAVAANPLPAVPRLDNWLPFLKRAPAAHADQDGIVVSEGEAGYALWGPYWTLPADDYELIVSILPDLAQMDGQGVITIDVTADYGRHCFAKQQWTTEQMQHGDSHALEVIGLPFTLAADLPIALRTIETRIYTSGTGKFRVRSLVVRIRRDELAQRRTRNFRGRGFGVAARDKFRRLIPRNVVPIIRKLRVRLKLPKFSQRP